ncbi:LysM peptidoglycan-binding domain-containing protein [Paraburkholderia sp. BR14374]|uniref:CIS tube protein n=1 Tax=Paraburkholderia sp. BR14374 TaxID=3237007 RepID=UPI0034D009C2
MLSPVQIAGQSLVQAYLEIVAPRVADPVIPLRFNPTEYQLQKANNFAEIAIPGLESPPIQFVRGASEKMTAEVLVDTSETLDDVRVAYVNKLRGLLDLNRELHAPPIVRFVWDTEVFRGVLESMNVTYVLFTPEGIPLRAKLALSLKEYRPVEIQIKENPTASPDYDKTYVVQRGDTLSSIAFAVYRDPGVWRDIARNNGISDPRSLEPGTVLQLPRLT